MADDRLHEKPFHGYHQVRWQTRPAGPALNVVTQLDREVALRVLPEAFTSDQAAIRERRLLAWVD